MDLLFKNSFKRYSHDLPYRVNTTSDFGSVQPLMCRFLDRKDKVSVNLKQLVRLAPMPSPTFADVKSVNTAVFVPVYEIFPNFDNLMGNTAIAGTTPTYTPIISSRCLWFLLMSQGLGHVDYCLTTNQNILQSDRSVLANVLETVYDRDPAVSYIFRNNDYEHFRANCPIGTPFIDPENQSGVGFVDSNYDLLINTTYASQGYTVGVRLSSAGKRVYKILRGCGYSMDFRNGSYVSLLPLMAFFKAYYDRYGISRKSNFTQTACFTLIRDFENYPQNRTPAFPGIYDFVLADLSNCYITAPLDYISVATDTPLSYMPTVDGAPNDPVVQNIPNPALSVKIRNTGSTQAYPAISNTGEITDITLRTLVKLSKFITADSLVGRKVSDWVRLHYGQRVLDDLFGSSHVIGDYTVQCQIDDVMSMADTTDNSNSQGNYLGAYAGKGIGFNNGYFDFETSTPGYVVILQGIEARIGHLGDNPQLYAIDRYTLPNQIYDGLGYEVTPIGAVAPPFIDYASLVDMPDDSYYTGSGFGYVPRMSMHKFQPDILNGDMATKSTHTVFDSYHDELLQINSGDPLMVANDLWRKPWAYTQYFNFNRIFYNSDGYQQGTSLDIYYDEPPVFDNFVVQCTVDLKHTNALKPLGASYLTHDSEDGELKSQSIK